MMRAFVALVCLACVGPALLAQDWPQWRGPHSNGVATVSSAPERWSVSDGVKWRAEIEGHGISSPVVAGGRVYLTTALVAQQRTPVRLACDALIGLLTVLGIPALLWHRWRQRRTAASEGPDGLIHRVIQTLDLTLCVLLGGAVVVFATLLVLGPNAVDRGLNAARDVGILFARYLGRQQTNLSFLDWDEGNRHNTWIICSAMSLASLALVAFLFPARSVMRLFIAVAVCAGVALAVWFVPWAAAYGIRFPAGALVVFYSPVIAVAMWHLLRFVAGRWRTAQGAELVAGMAARTAACVPVLLGLALFVSPNFLYEREMVTRRLICLDLSSGTVLWRTDVFSTPPETKSALNSGATPTPTVTGNTIVAAFGPGIAAVDIDGDVLWSKMFPRWIENSIYGAGSSPVTDGKAVYVSVDGEYEAEGQSRVMAHSARTGDELWIKAPGFAKDGYTTPTIYDDGSLKLLLTITAKTLAAYAAADGAVVWRLKVPVSQPIPSPIAENDRLYVTGGIGGGHTAAYKLRPDAAPEELWSTPQRADVSSPVLYRGRLFTISTIGVMVSYDAETGRVVWKRRVGSGAGGFYASLVAADGKIYAPRSNGTTYVVAAEDEFRLISESVLPEEMFASPAITEDCLLLRTVAALYCVGDTIRPALTSG
jgi:outer membrane protein assembly factor BamB